MKVVMELNKKRGMAMKKIKISYLLLGTNIILNLFLINKTMELSNYINSNSSLISVKKWLSPRSLREFNFKYSKRHRTNIGSMLYFSY